jgi:A/G-specific adenine glycosylase
MTDQDVPISERRIMARAIVRWFAGHARPLPWRSERTPYRVWISEVMAQQTRLATVVPYFERFVARFPDARALAAAPVDDVLALWAGLGYYRRARQLHAAARRLVERFGGELPAAPDRLRELPGVGPYIAGAIASLAFNLPAPILDGNVARVLSRVFAVAGDPARNPTRRRLWRLAEELLPAAAPRAFNEGLMELGALVCRPAAPLCTQCPLRRRCRAYADGRVNDFPQRTRRTKPKTAALAAALIRDARGRVLLIRNPNDGLFGGMWTAPQFAPARGLSPAAKRAWLAASLRARFGVEIEVGRRAGAVRHQLSHLTLHVQVYECRLVKKKMPRLGHDRRWLDPDNSFRSLAMPTLTRKVLALR